MRHPTESIQTAAEAAEPRVEPPRPVRRAPRQSRARRLSELVLQATAEVLRSRGHAGLSTNEVARQAGVSVGAIYQYHPDKAALLAAVRQRHALAMGAVLHATWREAAPRTRDAAVGALVRGLFAAHALDPVLHALLDEALGPLVALPPQETVADLVPVRWRGTSASVPAALMEPGALWATWRAELARYGARPGEALDVAAWASLQMADGLAHTAWVTAAQRPLPFALAALEAAAVQAVQAYLGAAMPSEAPSA